MREGRASPFERRSDIVAAPVLKSLLAKMDVLKFQVAKRHPD